MKLEHWRARILYVVDRAREGHPRSLDILAQRLTDLDIAEEALICHGFGERGDDICELTAAIFEAMAERESAP